MVKIQNYKRKIATTFGAALSSLFVAHDLQADFLTITWNGGLGFISFYSVNPNYTYSPVAQPADIDQIGIATDFSVLFTYTQFSDAYGDKFFYSNQNFGVVNQSITGIALLASGDTIDPDTFQPPLNAIGVNGNAFAAFRTSQGNVGWFRINFGFSFEEGQFGSDGESLVVGELKGDVNCDGAVDLLDITPFVELLAASEFSSKADYNLDGVVSLLDVGPFVNAIIE